VPTEGPLDVLPPRAALAGGLLLVLLLAALNPGGTEGDAHRAWVLGLTGLLGLVHAALRHRLRGPQGAEGSEPRAPGRAAVGAVALVLVVAGLQLVPLPRELLRALAPDSAALHDAIDAIDGVPAGARAASIEPVATARAALLGLAWVAAFLAARAVGRGPRAPANVLLLVAGGGALLAVGALVAQQEPTATWGQRARWPLVNPNHLATLLGLCLCAAVGVLVTPLFTSAEAGLADLEAGRGARAASRRGLAAVAIVLLVVGLLRTQSRAGAAAAVLGAAATLLLAGRSRAGLASAVGALVVTFALVGQGSSADAAALGARLERRDDVEGRLVNWAEALRVARGRPWLGSGLGTYDDASTAVLAPDRSATRPVKAHDDYLELAATIGWPAALLAMGALATSVVGCARGLLHADARRRALGAGALGAAVAALAHAAFDFGLQIPAVALLFAALLGLACGLAAEEPRRRAEPAPAPPAPPAPAPEVAANPPNPSARWAAALSASGRHGALEPPPAWRPTRPRLDAARHALLGGALVVAAALLVPQTAREAEARASTRRLEAGQVRDDLRGEVARRLGPGLAEADGWLATAEVPFLRAMVLVDGGASPLEAIEQARVAAARAPGRARNQAQLAVLELAVAAGPVGPANPDPERARARGGARLDLAVRLGPTLPRVLLARGQWALVELARTGAPERAEEAARLLARALERDPALRPVVTRLLKDDAARLGAAGERLAAELLGPR
jgi:O-antigen ligase